MVVPLRALRQMGKQILGPLICWSDYCIKPESSWRAMEFAPKAVAMKMTVIRILLVLSPLVVWMVSRIPMDGIAVADDRAIGRDVFLQNCALCHVSGLGMAPRIDNRLEWEHRLSAGRRSLQASVLRGKGGMPPKGGNASISDAQAVAALDYMMGRILHAERDAQFAGM